MLENHSCQNILSVAVSKAIKCKNVTHLDEGISVFVFVFVFPFLFVFVLVFVFVCKAIKCKKVTHPDEGLARSFQKSSLSCNSF